MGNSIQEFQAFYSNVKSTVHIEDIQRAVLLHPRDLFSEAQLAPSHYKMVAYIHVDEDPKVKAKFYCLHEGTVKESSLYAIWEYLMGDYVIIEKQFFDLAKQGCKLPQGLSLIHI
eukprot:2154568-Rhodomonas_salina.1